MRAFLLFCSPLLLCGIAAAQSSSVTVYVSGAPVSATAPVDQQLAAKLRIMEAHTVSSCPVTLAAHPQAGPGENLEINNGAKAAPHSLGLEIAFGEHAGSPVAGATVRVWGMSPHGRFLEAQNTSEPDASHVFEITPAGEDRSAAVWMRNVSALTRVDVEEVRYADGSEWHPAAGRRCSVVPDGVLRVAALQ